MAQTAADVIAQATGWDEFSRPVVSQEDGKKLIEAGATYWRERGNEVNDSAKNTTTLTWVVIFQGKLVVYRTTVPLETT